VIGENLPVDLIQKALDGLLVDIANINSLQQIVISGRADSMDTAVLNIQKTLPSPDALRFVPLNVSAPFHSRFMDTIKGRFQEVLNQVPDGMHPENAEKVTSNYTGVFHTNSSREIIQKLVEQLSHTVKWKDNMSLISQQASQICEIGPNRPLRKFFQSIGVNCFSITSYSSALREFQDRKSDDTI